MITSLINKVILCIGMAATANLTQISYKEVFVHKVAEEAKPPRKAKTPEFQKKESEPHQHQYDDLKCSLCGHVLRDGRRIYLDKKVEELEINSKKELEKCNRDLELEKSRLAVEKKKKAKRDTVYKHDTTKIKDYKVGKVGVKK